MYRNRLLIYIYKEHPMPQNGEEYILACSSQTKKLRLERHQSAIKYQFGMWIHNHVSVNKIIHFPLDHWGRTVVSR